MAIGERLMLAAHLRGSTLRSELIDLAREDVEAGGVRLVFGNCEPHLLSMNLSLGGRTYAERNINSEEAGYLIPLLFLEGDADGLAEAIGSQDGNGRPCLPPSIKAALDRADSVSSASLMATGEYWAHVEAALERLEQEGLHAFAGLDEAETRECISRSNIITCAAGDRVIKEGGSAHNLFLVLEGTLEVRHRGRLVNVLAPGDVFGELAFLLELPRQSDVYAATPGVKIISLSDGTLRKLMAEKPALAAKLLLNISRMLCGRLIKANLAADI
jgi:Cyclic nucleotide-binding domain